MSGAIPPLPQYAFMAWFPDKKIAGTTLPLPVMKTYWGVNIYISPRVLDLGTRWR
jgi:hypothetical protein